VLADVDVGVLESVDDVELLEADLLTWPGGPEWQWFVSPYPLPGLQVVLVPELVLVVALLSLAKALPAPPIPPAAANAPTMDSDSNPASRPLVTDLKRLSSCIHFPFCFRSRSKTRSGCSDPSTTFALSQNVRTTKDIRYSSKLSRDLWPMFDRDHVAVQ